MIVSRREKVRVGLFVVLAVVAVITVALALAGLTTKPTTTFYAIFEESISGLDVAQPVKYQGKGVGKVTRIGIDPDSLLPLVEFAIDPKTPIREDTSASLVVQGYATGLKYIELSKGSTGGPALQPGSRVQTRVSPFSQLDKFAADAQGAIQSGRQLMGNVERAVVSATARIDPTMDGIDKSIAALERALKEGEGAIAENRPNLRDSMTEMRSAIATLREVADDMKREDVMKKASATLASLDQAATSLAKLADSADRLLGRNAQAFEEILWNLRSTTRDLAEAAREIKERPSALIRDVPRGERRAPE